VLALACFHQPQWLGKVSFVSGSAIVSHALRHARGSAAVLVWLRWPRTTQAASPVFV